MKYIISLKIDSQQKRLDVSQNKNDMKIRLTICTLILINLSILGQRPGYILADSVDLNSDGIKEDIRMVIDSTTPSYALKINDEIYNSNTSECLECITGFKVVDIDTTDSHKEIEIEVGFIAANAVEVFSYNGKIIYAGHLVSQRYNNNGVVYSVDFRGRMKYKLNQQTKELDLIKQPYFYYGSEVVVSGKFPIFYEKELKTKVDEIKGNSKIRIILRTGTTNTSSGDIFLIESDDGVTGWISFYTLMEYTDLFRAG